MSGRKKIKTLAAKYREFVERQISDPDKSIRLRKEKVGHGVCPFCGKDVRRAGQIFCNSCRECNYDNVYQMFHTTNGWDRRPVRVMKIKDGWRGNGVTGRIAS